MNSIKLLSSIIISITLISFIYSCRKEDQFVNISERDKLLNELSSNQALNFFDPEYILRNNKHLRPSISIRSSHELIDSLFDALLELQILSPFAEDLVQLIGYPVWTKGDAHSQTNVQIQIDSLYSIVTIPFIGTTDSVTQGILTSVLVDEEWHSFIVTRDTLYSLFTSTFNTDPNIPAYLLGIIHYDYELFNSSDSIIVDLYHGDYIAHLQGNESVIMPRICVQYQNVVTYTRPCPTRALTDSDIEIVRREDCVEEVTEVFTWWDCYGGASGGGGNADVGQGLGDGSSPGGNGGNTGGSGSNGGNSGGSGNTGGNNGSSNCGGCGYTLLLIPYLCTTPLNLNIYGADFINLYNSIIVYLHPDQARWLLENANEQTLDFYLEFLNNYSSDQQHNGYLLNGFIDYLRLRSSGDLDLLEFSNSLSPYCQNFNSWENGWLFRHWDIMNEAEIEIFLALLSHVDLVPMDNDDYLLWAKDFVINYGMESVDYADAVYDAMLIDPEIKMERAEQIYAILESNEFAFIEDCLGPNDPEIDDYFELYNFDISENTQSYINSLGAGFAIQPIENGNVNVSNLDDYSFEVSTLPDLNGDNIPESMNQVFNYIRLGFTTLGSGTVQNFEFSCNNPVGPEVSDISWEFIPYFPQSEYLWNSSNAVNAIFKIAAQAEEPTLNAFADDGSVIISQHEQCCWINSSLKTPFAGNHNPFSGNRQFGYRVNQSGKMEIYTKAIDVAHRSGLIRHIALSDFPCEAETYYDIAIATWTKFQNEIKSYIENHGGAATVQAPFQITVDNEIIKTLLHSDDPISFIPCD